MTKKWIDIAEKTLKPGDEVQFTFNAAYDDQNGLVILSRKKLLFLNEKGFFQKKYDLLLEVPYDKVEEVRRIGNILTLLVGGKSHAFKSGYASAIEQSIKDLTESMTITVH